MTTQARLRKQRIWTASYWWSPRWPRVKVLQGHCLSGEPLDVFPEEHILTLSGGRLDRGKAEECAGGAATWVRIISMGS